MNKYIKILTIILLFPAFLQAQSIAKARRQMDEYNYINAIEILKKAVLDDRRKNDAIPLLAECYRIKREIGKAKETYAIAITLPSVKPEYYYYYAEALQLSGDYLGAKIMFQKYAEKNPTDPRRKQYIANCDSVLMKWRQFSTEYEVKIDSNINTNANDFGPSFYQGKLIFASDYAGTETKKIYNWTGYGYLDIMQASPKVYGDFYGAMNPPTKFDSKFNKQYHDGPATFSSDGRSIYFTRSSNSNYKQEGLFKTSLLQVFYCHKTDTTWGEVKPFYLNKPEYSVGHPALSFNGQTLYFASDMPGGEGGTDIYLCKREGDGWGGPIKLGPMVNTKGNEMFPYACEDGSLFFASDGQPGFGGLDIFSTKNINGRWTTPVNLKGPINGSYDDFAIAFAPGLKNGFFSSNRPNGIGNDDIYAFRKMDPIALPLLPTYLSGIVKDKTTMTPLADATVFLYNTNTSSVKILKTDINGIYFAKVVKPTDYIAKAMKTNYIADCTPFVINKLQPGDTIIAPRELLLDKLIVNKTFKIDNIYYDFDKYDIREDAKPELDKLVRIMKENTIAVELGSHTDCRGSHSYNDNLSQKRAESAVNYIIDEGININRILAKGYGESQLLNKCADGVDCTAEEHQENRRTEFKVISLTPKETIPEYNLSNFTDGEERADYVFPEGFFNNCFLDKPIENVATTAALPIIVDTMPFKAANEDQIPITETKKQETKAVAEPAQSYKYRVQILSLTKQKSLHDPEFRGLKDVRQYIEENYYKYSSGLFSTKTEAQEYRNKMVKLGFTDAFVVKDVIPSAENPEINKQ
ncbi:MAG: OmpA family protein [Bacteroidales bacterium]